MDLLLISFTPPNTLLRCSTSLNHLSRSFIHSFIVYCVSLTLSAETTPVWRLTATKFQFGRIILSPNLSFTVAPHNTLQPHGHYTCSFTSVAMSDNCDHIDWDAFVYNLGSVHEGEAEQRRPQPTLHYSTVSRRSKTTCTVLALTTVVQL